MKKTGHFIVLDGLRGVAALAVFCLHMSFLVGFKTFPTRAYLAVDFFFMLSGFVLAKSYETRLKTTMGFTTFVKIRLVRLYPLFALGTILGAIELYLHIRHGGPLSPAMTYHNLAVSLALGLLILPFGPVTPKTMPLDEPLWSIMFELLINFVYAAFIKILSQRVLACSILVCAIVMGAALWKNGDVPGGDTNGALLSALPRVTLSFFFGVLLYRFYKEGAFHQLPGCSPLLLAVLLLASFLPSSFGLGWAYDMACIVILFPAIIILGSKDALSPRSIPLAAWSGRLSYPLYVLHKPIINHISFLKHESTPVRILGIGATMAFVAALSAVITVAADEPFRKWLSGKMRRQTVSGVDSQA